MKLLSVRCSICLNFHNAARYDCPYCGAIHVGRKEYNRVGREMARAIPIPLERCIDSYVKYAGTIPEPVLIGKESS